MIRHSSLFLLKRPLHPSRIKIYACSFSSQHQDDDDIWSKHRVTGFVGHNFPDFIEHWSRDTFRKVGYGLGASTGALAALSAAWSPTLVAPAVVAGILTTAYWRVGLNDMKQTSHAIRRNYPVLGNMRYIFEAVSRIL
jgi:hypothetical protein